MQLQAQLHIIYDRVLIMVSHYVYESTFEHALHQYLCMY